MDGLLHVVEYGHLDVILRVKNSGTRSTARFRKRGVCSILCSTLRSQMRSKALFGITRRFLPRCEEKECRLAQSQQIPSLEEKKSVTLHHLGDFFHDLRSKNIDHTVIKYIITIRAGTCHNFILGRKSESGRVRESESELCLCLCECVWLRVDVDGKNDSVCS